MLFRTGRESRQGPLAGREMVRVLLRRAMGTLRPTDPLNTEWVAGFFVLVMAALAWIHAISPRKWRLLAHAAGRMRLGRQVMREDVDLRDRTLIGLLVVGTSVTGLFCYQWAVSRAGLEAAWFRAVESMVIALMLVTVQIALIRLGSFLFQSDGGAEEYVYTVVLLSVLAGVVLLPVSLLVAYRPEWRPALLIIGWVCLGAMVLLRWLRAVAIGVGSGAPLRYIFIYLCALEILPVAIALRSLQQALLPDVRPH